MTDHDGDRVWTQDELRAHLRTLGWTEAECLDCGEIPQGVKFVAKPAPLTKRDIEQAKKLIAEHPEWQKSEPKRRAEGDER